MALPIGVCQPSIVRRFAQPALSLGLSTTSGLAGVMTYILFGLAELGAVSSTTLPLQTTASATAKIAASSTTALPLGTTAESGAESNAVSITALPLTLETGSAGASAAESMTSLPLTLLAEATVTGGSFAGIGPLPFTVEMSPINNGVIIDGDYVTE